MKPTKKAIRESAERAELGRRMRDMLYGAVGDYECVDIFSDEIGGLAAELGLDSFGRWLGAMQQHLTFVSDGQRKLIVTPRFLEHFDIFDKAVTKLYEMGVRA